MKLYLSSYRLGNHADFLSANVLGKKRIAVISNALDFSQDLDRLEQSKQKEFTALESIGFTPIELDLRNFFGKKDELLETVLTLDAVWVVGGNTFILRRAMYQSGFDEIITDLKGNDNFVYAGYSAGICVLSPTLRGIHLTDDPDYIPALYDKCIIWEGLKFVPFCFAPHYRSNHFESEAIEKSVEYYIENKIPFIALKDGEEYIGKV